MTLDMGGENGTREWTHDGKSMHKVFAIYRKYSLYTTKKQKNNSITWQNAEEGACKQLDYIMISNKQRNWVTQVRTKGTANPNSTNQHQVLLLLLKMRIRVKKANLTSQQRHIQFDIDTLRDNPTDLQEKWTQGKYKRL